MTSSYYDDYSWSFRIIFVFFLHDELLGDLVFQDDGRGKHPDHTVTTLYIFFSSIQDCNANDQEVDQVKAKSYEQIYQPQRTNFPSIFIFHRIYKLCSFFCYLVSTLEQGIFHLLNKL